MESLDRLYQKVEVTNSNGKRIAIVGAEGTSKTWLALSIIDAVGGPGVYFDSDFGAEEALNAKVTEGAEIYRHNIDVPKAIGVKTTFFEGGDDGKNIKQNFSELDQKACMRVYTEFREKYHAALADPRIKWVIVDTQSVIHKLRRAAHLGKLQGVKDVYYSTVNLEANEDAVAAAPEKCGGKFVIWLHHVETYHKTGELQADGHPACMTSAEVILWCERTEFLDPESDPASPQRNPNFQFRVNKFRGALPLLGQVWSLYDEDTGEMNGDYDLPSLLMEAG